MAIHTFSSCVTAGIAGVPVAMVEMRSGASLACLSLEGVSATMSSTLCTLVHMINLKVCVKLLRSVRVVGLGSSGDRSSSLHWAVMGILPPRLIKSSIHSIHVHPRDASSGTTNLTSTRNETI